jgi:hypothetical protein
VRGVGCAVPARFVDQSTRAPDCFTTFAHFA